MKHLDYMINITKSDNMENCLNNIFWTLLNVCKCIMSWMLLNINIKRRESMFAIKLIEYHVSNELLVEN